MAPVYRKRKVPECSTSESSTTTTSKSKLKHKSSTKSSKHARTNINRLSIDCFCLIFGCLPIRTLLPLRRVSHSWNDDITQLCTRKQRLTLIPYSDDGPHCENAQDIYWTDDLKGYIADRTKTNRHDGIEFAMTSLTDDALGGLHQLFPRLTELRIHYDCDYESSQPAAIASAQLVGHMIRAFASDQLKSFQFWLPTNPINIQDKYRFMLPLYKMFGENLTRARFPSLTQLDLCIVKDRYLWPEETNYRIDFAIATEPNNNNINILFQLERFSMKYHINHNEGELMLSQLGPQLSSLSIEFESFGNIYPPDTLLDSVQFDGLTHLSIDNFHPNVRLLQLFCDRFKVLQFVQLKLCDIYRASPFYLKWFKQLTKLDQLTELRIHNFRMHQFESTISTQSLPSIRKLAWVKADLLESYCRDGQFNGNTFCRSLAAQFPKLEELIILCDTRSHWTGSQTQLKVQIRDHLDHNFVNLRTVLLDLDAPEFEYTNRNLER